MEEEALFEEPPPSLFGAAEEAPPPISIPKIDSLSAERLLLQCDLILS
jgi:hypothetical protein